MESKTHVGIIVSLCILLAILPGSYTHSSHTKGKCQWKPKVSERSDNLEEAGELDNSWWESVPGQEFVNKYHPSTIDSLQNRNQHFFIMFYLPCKPFGVL